jgi:DNA-directed RNA polymerase sigma subunit (sigma70/sigma32)
MYKSDEGYGGWRYLGREDEVPGEDLFGDELSISYNLQQTVDKTYETTYTNKGSLNNMTKQEELLLIEQAQSGSEMAKRQVVEKYELLCHKIARKFGFTAPNADHDDLFQEAQIGLLKAIASYDVSKGASFMTWAFYAVRGAVVSSGKTDRKQPR